MKRRILSILLVICMSISLIPTVTTEVHADDHHSHSFSDTVIAPGCTTEGYTLHTCSCGETYTDSPVAALNHQWDEGKIVRESTCTEAGQLTYTCTVCGDMTSEALPRLSGSLQEVGVADSVLARKYLVMDPKTGSSETFSYETPEGGVTLLVFFSHLCGNSQNLMRQLDDCKWLSNPYLKVVAVESKATDAAAVMDFISTYSPNTAPLIQYRYASSTKLAFAYYRMFSNESSMTWPLVLVISDDGTVRFGTDAATSTADIYQSLCCASEAFAAYEQNGEVSPPETTTCSVQVSGTREYDEAQEVLRLMNGQRQAAGLAPLILDETLLELAMLRATECALYYSHTRPSGAHCSTVLEGYYSDYAYNGENIAAGYRSADEVMEGWMNSEGHRNNILRSNSSHVGIGCVNVGGTKLWVQFFAKSLPSQTSATAAGQMPFRTKVTTLKEHISPVITPGTIKEILTQDQLGKWTKRIALTTVNPGYSYAFATLIPTLSEVKDAQGNVIATLTDPNDGTGLLILTAMAEGTGTVTLPVYAGQTEPAVLTVSIHVHDYTETVVPPTCTEGGRTEYVCACGDSYIDNTTEPTGHSWDEGTVTQEPTTDMEGVRTFSCANGCGETKTEAIPKLEPPVCQHTETTVTNQEDASCTADGYSGDTVCAACGEMLQQGEVIPATGHSWDDGTITVQPTVDAKGVMTFSCANGCGETKTEAIPKLEPPVCQHTETTVTNQEDASCTTDGYSGNTVCAACGEMLQQGEVIPATGHSWDDGTVTQEPTTDTEGVKTFSCTNGCGETKTEAIPKLEPPACQHTETTVTNQEDASCTTDGYSGDTVCAACGEMLQQGEVIPATGHSWDEGTVTQEPTIDMEGVRTFSCTNGCGETKTEAIPKLEPPVCEHTETTVTNQKDATCTINGYSGDTVCAACGEMLQQGKVIPATGHNWQDGKCSVCGKADPTYTEPTEPEPTEPEPTEPKPTEPKPTEPEPTEPEPTEPEPTEPEPTEPEPTEPEPTEPEPTEPEPTEPKPTEPEPTEPEPTEPEPTEPEPTQPEPTEPKPTEPEPTEPEPTEPEPTEPEPTEPVVPGDGFTRLAGGNRFETAFMVADAMKAQLGIDLFDSVIVASGTSFADALSGSYLAAVKNAPILLSYTTDAINDSVKDYIRANLKPGGTVYILGGTSAVPASMEAGLEDFTLRRLAGNDRFGTNLAILKEAGVEGKDVLVCTGLEFADSLSASAAKLPILLVWKELTDAQRDFLNGISGDLYVIGGTSAVSDSLLTQVSEYGFVTRLGGGNRFETSVLIAKTFFPGAEQAVLAYAWDFPDGLCGGPLAVAADAPLILTMTCYEATAAEYTVSQGITRGMVLGGVRLISDASVNAIAGMASPGHDYGTLVTEPSCTGGGYSTHTCRKCGHTYTDARTKPLGHDFETATVYATFDEGGYTQSTCTICGHSQKDQATEPLSAEIKRVWELVNQARAEAGLEPVDYYFAGQEAGDIRASEVRSYFDHTRPNGQICFSVFDELGLERYPAGENIASGYPSAEAVMQGWMNSQGHRDNILNPSARGLIIGKNGSAWVMLLTY